jgi:hypothetical protein
MTVGGVVVVAMLAAASFARSPILRSATAVAGGFGLFVVQAFGYFRFRVDDAYITYRYARNLSDGLGPVWNPGERVEGYTSFLWMVLLAALHLAGIDIELASVLLSCACAFALFVLIWCVWRRLAPDATQSSISPHLVMAGIVVLAAANSSSGEWSMAGLETPLAATLLMALIFAYQRESRSPGLPWTALILVAAVMTRPEMMFIAALTGAFFLDQAITDGGVRRWQHLASFCSVFGLLAGAWYVWRWSYYGYFFPNTYYDKVGPLDLMIVRGMTYLQHYWWPYLVAPGLIASAILPFLLQDARRRDAAYICATGVVWIAVVATEGGDVFDRGRFVQPILAPLYIALLLATSELLNRARVERVYKMSAFAAIVVGLATLVAWAPGAEAQMKGNRHILAEWKVEGQWVKQNVPSDYVTGVFAAGNIPYFSEGKSLDLLGLTDTTIAHTSVPLERHAIPGHEKYNTDYVLEVRRPQLIFFGAASTTHLTAEELRKDVTEDRGLVPAVTDLVHDERTWEMYTMAAFWHDGLWYPFLVRKDVANNVNAGWVESPGVVADERGG